MVKRKRIKNFFKALALDSTLLDTFKIRKLNRKRRKIKGLVYVVIEIAPGVTRNSIEFRKFKKKSNCYTPTYHRKTYNSIDI